MPAASAMPLVPPCMVTVYVVPGINGDAGVIETVSDAFARNYLRLTDGIWFISEGVVAEDVRTGWLSVLPADTGDTFGPVGLTTRTDTALPLPAQLLAAALRELVAQRAMDTAPHG